MFERIKVKVIKKDDLKVIDELAEYGYSFYEALYKKDIEECAKIMEKNFKAQKRLAPSTTNKNLEEIYAFAKRNGVIGGKIAGAGGGGTFLLICKNKSNFVKQMKKEFVETFEIDFDFEYRDIKKLNTI